MNGILIKAISGFYYVISENRIYECKARGNLRKAGVFPVCGDRVEITATDDSCGIIDNVCERRNILKRPAVANIDKLIIVSSFSTPAPDTLMIDRLSAIAIYNNIKPIIVFNKCDQGDFSELEYIYNKSGFNTYVVSTIQNLGLPELRNEFKSSVCAFAGNSGVGKSSLINALFNNMALETGAVSEKLGRGRHTTRHTELFSVSENAYIVDTPGFSSLDIGYDYNFKLRLAECFPEFKPFISLCRFTGCSHTCENDCAVLEAAQNNKIEYSRLRSYQMLYTELKALKPWEKKH